MACVRTLGTRGHLSAPRAGGWPASSCLGDQRLPPTPETGTKEELWGWFGTTTIQVPTQALSCACCSLCTRTHTFVHAHTCPQVHTFIHARAHVCSCVHTQTPKQPCDHPLCAPGSPLGGHQAEPCAVPASGASGGRLLPEPFHSAWWCLGVCAVTAGDLALSSLCPAWWMWPHPPGPARRGRALASAGCGEGRGGRPALRLH